MDYPSVSLMLASSPYKGSLLYLRTKQKAPLLRGAKPLFYDVIYILANTLKITDDLIIGNSYNLYPIPFKKLCALVIVSNAAFFIVLRSIKFYYDFRLGAIEVDDVLANSFLTFKSYGVLSQKIIPQFSFPWGHLFAQGSC